MRHTNHWPVVWAVRRRSRVRAWERPSGSGRLQVVSEGWKRALRGSVSRRASGWGLPRWGRSVCRSMAGPRAGIARWRGSSLGVQRLRQVVGRIGRRCRCIGVPSVESVCGGVVGAPARVGQRVMISRAAR